MMLWYCHRPPEGSEITLPLCGNVSISHLSPTFSLTFFSFIPITLSIKNLRYSECLARSEECVTITTLLQELGVCNLCMTTPVNFLRETYDELKKVVWPTRQEVIRLTVIVIIISVIVGLYIGGIDFIFTKITELLLR